jgi:Uma2 family endonuclease
MSADEFLEFVQRPENENRCFELVRGEVIELPSPTKIHGRVCINAGFLLESYVRQRGYGYITGNDAGTLLERDPDTVRGPDVALFEDANSFQELHPKYGNVPPILAVEVLSPSDKMPQVLRKINDYLGNGVKLVWLVDPEESSVWVFEPDMPSTEYRFDQELTGGAILPGFTCKVADFFFVPGKPPG